MKRIEAQLRALRRIRRRRRRRTLIAGGAALSATVAAALSLAYFTEVDPVAAAIARAKSLVELMDRRSPGERVAGVLIKTKHRHYRVLAERAAPEMPIPVLGPALVDVLATPVAMPEVAVPEAELLAPKTPPGLVFVPPGIVCCETHHPPPPPPPPPPTGVPEPGTWMTMILGFGVSGLMLRRRHARGGKPANA